MSVYYSILLVLLMQINILLQQEIDTKLKTVTDDTTEFIDWLVVQVHIANITL